MLKSTGWKGIVGGVGLMLYAVLAVVIKMVLPESAYGLEVTTALPVFLAGLAALGIRLAVK